MTEQYRHLVWFGVAVFAGVALGQSCSETSLNCTAGVGASSDEIRQLQRDAAPDMQAITQKCQALKQRVDQCVSALEPCTDTNSTSTSEALQASYNALCSQEAMCRLHVIGCSIMAQSLVSSDHHIQNNDSCSFPDPLSVQCLVTVDPLPCLTPDGSRVLDQVKQCVADLDIPQECDSDDFVLGVKSGVASLSTLCEDNACPHFVGCLYSDVENLDDICSAVPPITECYENQKGQCTFDESGVTFKQVEQLGADFCQVLSEAGLQLCAAVKNCTRSTPPVQEMDGYGAHRQVDKLMEALNSPATWCQYVRGGIDCAVSMANQPGCSLSASMVDQIKLLQIRASVTCKTSGAGTVHVNWILTVISLITLTLSRLRTV